MWKPSTPYQGVMLSCCSGAIGAYCTMHNKPHFIGCSTTINKGAHAVTSEDSRNLIAVAVPPADVRALSCHTAVAGKSTYSMVMGLQTVYRVGVWPRGMYTSHLPSSGQPPTTERPVEAVLVGVCPHGMSQQTANHFTNARYETRGQPRICPSHRTAVPAGVEP